MEGEKEFKKALTDINQSFKVLDSEMKLVYRPKHNVRKLRVEKESLFQESAAREELKKRMSEMIRFLENSSCDLTEFEENIMRILVDRITVYVNHLKIDLKSGISVDIKEWDIDGSSRSFRFPDWCFKNFEVGTDCTCESTFRFIWNITSDSFSRNRNCYSNSVSICREKARGKERICFITPVFY